MSPAKKTRRTPVVDKQAHHDKKLQKRKLINSDLDTPGKNMDNIQKAKKTRCTPVVDKQARQDKKLQKRKLIITTDSDLDTPGKNMDNIQKVTPDANTGGPATRTRGGKQAHREKKLHKRKLIISPDSDLDTPGGNMQKMKKVDVDAGGPATRTRAGQQSRAVSKTKKIVKRKLIVSVDSDSEMAGEFTLGHKGDAVEPEKHATVVRETKKEKQERVLRRSGKPPKSNNWPKIKTRSAPMQLYKCIKSLTSNQQEDVKRMGFGKMLSFNISSIPAKLAHYVVDHFNTEEMAIEMSCGSISVDVESVHDLFGIPNKGINMQNVKQSEKLDGAVMAWRKRYRSRFVAPTKLAQSISTSDEDNSFNFRLDFLMLFLTVMVECNRNGRMKEWILKSLTGNTDFSKINWCAYVIQQIKSCKDGWKRYDPDSPFSGPLTLLALLYVDRVKCTGLEVDRSINPIVLWNKNELKKRERLEIKTGGFGRGSLHEVAVVKRDFRKTELRVNDEVLNNEIESITKHLDVMEAKKLTVQKKLEVVFNAHPRNVQVQKLIQRYEKIVHSRKTRVWLVPDTPQKKIAGVLMSLKKTMETPENDYTEDQDNAATATEVANVDDEGEGDKTQEKIPDSPTTTQKNVTCVVTRDEESQAKDQEKKASPIKLDTSNETQNMEELLDGPTFDLLTQETDLGADVDETTDAMNQEDKKSKEEETKNKINGKFYMFFTSLLYYNKTYDFFINTNKPKKISRQGRG
ncbi:hypothetical protein HanHA89_Chr14g0572631 [Helianthus annuus]|nr:hypothetical protein HanHA89_Chr14g0572631 [Helianthus annuus]